MSAELAAWVQAVGSVVAIFAAIGIAWWQHRESRITQERADKDRTEASEARARSVALELYRHLIGLSHSLTMVASIKSSDNVALAVGLARLVDLGWLDRARLASSDLGPASKPVQMVLFNLETFQVALADLNDPDNLSNTELSMRMLKESARSASEGAQAAVREMTLLFVRAADH